MGMSGVLIFYISATRDRAIIDRDHKAAVAASHELDAYLRWHRRHADHLYVVRTLVEINVILPFFCDKRIRRSCHLQYSVQ